MMRSDMQNAASPAAYLAGFDGWRLKLATSLRRAVKKSVGLDEQLKWGHLVYFSGGPMCLIRVEANRVLFGFWRGKRLREIEPRLKPGGKYEMATLDLRAGDTIKPAVAAQLVAAAVKLNAEFGDPTKLSPPHTLRPARTKASSTNSSLKASPPITAKSKSTKKS